MPVPRNSMKFYSFEIAGRRSVGVEKNGKLIDRIVGLQAKQGISTCHGSSPFRYYVILPGGITGKTSLSIAV